MPDDAAQHPSAAQRAARELLKGVKVVDADTHITEWPDLWTSRAPARYKDRVPQRRTVDGVTKWMIDDFELARNYGYSAIMKDGSKLAGLDFFNHPLEDVTRGAYDLKARLDYLDEAGIAAQIAYTNLLGFGGGKSMKVDKTLREVSIQIQNDAMAELQAASNNRVYPMAMIPWWDLEASLKEAKRCADMGLRGINTHSNPQHHGLPEQTQRFVVQTEFASERVGIADDALRMGLVVVALSGLDGTAEGVDDVLDFIELVVQHLDAQQRPDARQKLDPVEGLGEEIIRARAFSSVTELKIGSYGNRGSPGKYICVTSRETKE